MKRAVVLAIPFALATSGAWAAQSTGNAALALAGLIGAVSPTLSASERAVLVHFLNGETNVPLPANAHRITVTADKVTCRMGDVDVGLHDCELTFGAKTVTRTGSAGQALLATMQENGVEADGTAGTIYYSVAPITCTIDASEIETHDGGGATCTFMNGR